ncbi:MAG: ribosome maturation factor RimP [Chromatiales bacterium]|nr:ribosome maturation factor RimP [Chromatiales bacterium]
MGLWPIFCFRCRETGPDEEVEVIREKLVELLEPVVERLGYELSDLEFVKARHGRLRIFIDHPEGVDLDACEAVSHAVSAVLDVEDPLPGEYVLEVSSPGMDRRLVKPGHFDRFAGERIRLRFRRLLDGRRKIEGVLAAREGNLIRVRLDEGEDAVVPLEEIEVARLVPQW